MSIGLKVSQVTVELCVQIPALRVSPCQVAGFKKVSGTFKKQKAEEWALEKPELVPQGKPGSPTQVG